MIVVNIQAMLRAVYLMSSANRAAVRLYFKQRFVVIDCYTVLLQVVSAPVLAGTLWVPDFPCQRSLADLLGVAMIPTPRSRFLTLSSHCTFGFSAAKSVRNW